MIPVDVDPDAAREAAATELADLAYQAAEPSLVDRFLTWLGRWFVDLLSALGGGSGAIGLLVLVVVTGIVGYALTRLRRNRKRAARTVFTDHRRREAVDHRTAAEDAHARGDLDIAVRERFRAIVRELETRGVLDRRDGRTADECAAQAGRRLPDRAHALTAAATVFDDVVYGGRHATEAAYRDLTALDDDLRTVAAR